ncbi:MAG: TRAP transporter fused permease subunit [Syntrophorhabdaceae bacterium]|nr:TRAP transporter fused permease subunit [Syntrophorhabdaceae bacterium]MDD4197065.1 TRAP transporter fused permease subunit [Syntrophorhabdaceae bacterium]
MTDSTGTNPATAKPGGKSLRSIIIFITAVGMAAFQIYTAGVRPFPGVIQRIVHLVFVMVLVFLMYPLRAKSTDKEETNIPMEDRKLSVLDVLLVLVSVFIGSYVFIEYEALSFRTGMPNLLDSCVSFAGILLVLEATRRMIGWPFIIICLLGFVYVAFGQYLPAFMAHTGFSFEETINFNFFSTEGILGLPLGVSSTTIACFIIFGAFLNVSGAGSLFIDMGLALFGRFRGGPAKAAILACCLFGMITGSQVAAVAAVGVFTIPLMVRTGYQPMTAASITALAGTGGMLVPPVMGAVAFIIPDMIGGTYWDVCRSQLIPGLFFYVAVYMLVELQSAKLGLKGVPKSELPAMGKVLKERGYMILPIIVLLLAIAVLKFSPVKAGFWAIVCCVLVSYISPKTRMTPKKILLAFQKGAKGCLIVAICCASAGLITGVISMTGMGERFSDILIMLSGESLLPLLFLTMIASLVIGLPLPPVTCYLILAVIAAPALIKAGVNPMAAHLFVFFFGALGNISPPAAPTSFTAAGLAGTDPMKTTNITFMYCLPAFFVPYLYVFRNELLLMGSPLNIVAIIITSFLGISCMAVAFHGYLLKNIKVLERLLFLLTGIGLIYPNWVINVVALVMAGILTGIQLISVRRQAVVSLVK